MDLLQTIRKEGSRGGKADFKWEDVKESSRRENYLGHSLMAPVGRWQQGRDLTWYSKPKTNGENPDDETESRNDVDPAARRQEEIRKIKAAEEAAMAAALGLPVPSASGSGEAPASGSLPPPPPTSRFRRPTGSGINNPNFAPMTKNRLLNKEKEVDEGNERRRGREREVQDYRDGGRHRGRHGDAAGGRDDADGVGERRRQRSRDGHRGHEKRARRTRSRSRSRSRSSEVKRERGRDRDRDRDRDRERDREPRSRPSHRHSHGHSHPHRRHRSRSRSLSRSRSPPARVPEPRSRRGTRLRSRSRSRSRSMSRSQSPLSPLREKQHDRTRPLEDDGHRHCHEPRRVRDDGRRTDEYDDRRESRHGRDERADRRRPRSPRQHPRDRHRSRPDGSPERYSGKHDRSTVSSAVRVNSPTRVQTAER